MSGRKVKQANRLALLLEIDRLDSQRCDRCLIGATHAMNNSRCDCPAAVQIRELGKELLAISPEAKPRRKPKVIEANKPQQELTVAIYDEMKANKVTDRAIMEKYGFHAISFNQWKHKHNRISKKGVAVQPKQQPKKTPTPEDLVTSSESALQKEELVRLRAELAENRQRVKTLEAENERLQDAQEVWETHLEDKDQTIDSLRLQIGYFDQKEETNSDDSRDQIQTLETELQEERHLLALLLEREAKRLKRP